MFCLSTGRSSRSFDEPSERQASGLPRRILPDGDGPDHREDRVVPLLGAHLRRLLGGLRRHLGVFPGLQGSLLGAYSR